MKLKLAGIFLGVFWCFFATAQEYKISGYIKDVYTNQPVKDVLVYCNYDRFTTNADGYYELYLKRDEYKIDFLYGSQLVFSTKLIVFKDSIFNFSIDKSQIFLETIVITEKKSKTINKVILDDVELKKIPPLLGEYDYIKALAFQPGVNTGSEAGAGLHVRGGTPDQNLILLDGATVYNNTHLFGLVSNFNPEVIKDVELIKGGIPAKFGGRLSSVTIINTLDAGNTHESNFSMGLINSQFTTKGPIIKDKLTYLLSGRVVYPTLVTIPFQLLNLTSDVLDNSVSYNIYDFNGNLNYKINDKHNLKISFYNGADYLSVKDKFRFNENKVLLKWGNLVGSLQWNNNISNSIKANTILSFSNFYLKNHLKNKIGRVNDWQEIILSSSVADISLKHQYNYFFSDKQQFTTGIEIANQSFKPGNYKFINMELPLGVISERNLRYSALLFSPYAEYQYTLQKIKMISGLRWSNYFINNAHFNYLEPRLQLSYIPNTRQSFSYYFNYSSQPIHQLSLNNLSQPFDIWLPSTTILKPQTAIQHAVNYTISFVDNKFELSIGGYYKTLTNLIELKVGENWMSVLNNDIFNLIEKNGIGRAKGVEFMWSKKKGKFTYNLAYTLSSNERKFDNLNNAQWYLAMYNRTHDLSLNTYMPLGEKWTFAATFVIQSGFPFTAPIALMENSFGEQTLIFGPINNAKAPIYHRLDFAFINKYITQKGRKAEFSIGAYNAYHNINPFYVSITQDYRYGNNFSISNIDSYYKSYAFFGIIPFFNYKIYY
jgi:hypothetical protein